MNPRRANVWTLLAGQFGPLLALLLVFILFAVADATQPSGGRFTSLRNLQTMLVSSAPVVVGALGMTVIIIAGGHRSVGRHGRGLMRHRDGLGAQTRRPRGTGTGLLRADRLCRRQRERRDDQRADVSPRLS